MKLAEQNVISGLLTNDNIDYVYDSLKPEMFEDALLGKMYYILMDANKKKESADITYLSQRLTELPEDIVNNELIPALDRAGDDFGKNKIFLPQLILSANAAQACFAAIKAAMSGETRISKGKIVLATVKGDIHDIGKNIARLLLESYGFDVADLGKDVEPEAILEAVTRLHAPIAGLSALMTTTVPAMEETIALLKEKAPWCRVLTGGAVLTADFAESIGSDCYAKDAMDTVRYAESLPEENGAPADGAEAAGGDPANKVTES